MASNGEHRFKNDINYRLYRIKHFGVKHGWRLEKEDGEVLEFSILHLYGNPKIILKIKYISFEIETQLKHPARGFTKLLRHGKFSMKLIESIFINPRVHMPQRITGTYVHTS